MVFLSTLRKSHRATVRNEPSSKEDALAPWRRLRLWAPKDRKRSSRRHDHRTLHQSTEMSSSHEVSEQLYPELAEQQTPARVEDELQEQPPVAMITVGAMEDQDSSPQAPAHTDAEEWTHEAEISARLEAIHILEGMCGPSHPDVLFSMKHLGRCYERWGDYENAELCYQRAHPQHLQPFL